MTSRIDNNIYIILSLVLAGCFIVGALLYSQRHIPVQPNNEISTWLPESNIGVSVTATKQEIEDNQYYRALLDQAKQCIKFVPAYNGLSLSVFLNSGYYMNLSQEEKTCISEWRQGLEEYRQKQLEEQSKGWPTYTNTKLGISFIYPPVTSEGEMLFIQAGNILYLTSSSSPVYAHRSEILNLTNDKDIIKAIHKLECPDGPCMDSWMIVTKDIQSDADLKRMIQDKVGTIYPNGCKLGKLFPDKQDGIYGVGIDPVIPGLDPENSRADSSCWLNWSMPFKYSPQYKRAAIWNIGQDNRFYPDREFQCLPHSVCDDSYADYIMADSFKFVQRTP